MTGFPTNPGRSFPLGATVHPEGVNFSVFSKGAAGVELLLFGEMDAPQPERVIALDPRQHRTYHYWHVPSGQRPGLGLLPAAGAKCGTCRHGWKD